MKKIDFVFLVDDDAIVQFSVRRLLEKSGKVNSVAVFSNGEEALMELNHLQSNKANLPELIFLDLNMPVMDGWEFLENIKSNSACSKIPVVILSSSIDPEDKQKANLFDLTTFIGKPLSISQIDSIVLELSSSIE